MNLIKILRENRFSIKQETYTRKLSSLKQRTPDVNQLLQRNKLAAEQEQEQEQTQHNNCIKQILNLGMALATQSTEEEEEYSKNPQPLKKKGP